MYVNGIVFLSVIWNVCLNGLFKFLFCSIVLEGTRKSWIFPQFMLSLVLLLICWAVLIGARVGYKVLISFQVGILNNFILLLSLLKNPFQDLVVEIHYFGLSKRNGIVQSFSLDCFCLYILIHVVCI